MTEKEREIASESLLTAWLTTSALIRNERIVQVMTFREISVCNILYNSHNTEVTATDIISVTGMLKSQVNKVLTDMELKGYVTRERATDDKRKIIINFTDKGREAYEDEHAKIVKMLDVIISNIGIERIASFTETMIEIAKLVDYLGKEND